MGNPLSDRPLDDPAILALRKPGGVAMKRYLDHEADAACRRAGLGGPATSADLLDPTLQRLLQKGNADLPTLPGLATLTAKVAALSDPEPLPAAPVAK